MCLCFQIQDDSLATTWTGNIKMQQLLTTFKFIHRLVPELQMLAQLAWSGSGTVSLQLLSLTSSQSRLSFYLSTRSRWIKQSIFFWDTALVSDSEPLIVISAASHSTENLSSTHWRSQCGGRTKCIHQEKDLMFYSIITNSERAKQSITDQTACIYRGRRFELAKNSYLWSHYLFLFKI